MDRVFGFSRRLLSRLGFRCVNGGNVRWNIGNLQRRTSENSSCPVSCSSLLLGDLEGVVSGFLISKFGIAIITYIAAFLTAIGFLRSFLAISIYQVYGFISVITGVFFVWTSFRFLRGNLIGQKIWAKWVGLVSTMCKIRARLKHKWVVFVTSIVVAFFNFGFPSSMGAMYIGILDTFGAGRARTALVYSLLTAVCLIFGVVSAYLISKLGITAVTYIAALMSALGFFCSYFASSIYELYGFISIVTGMAFATMYISAVVCVGWTFTGRQQSMVLAIQSVGTAIAGFMWPTLLTASIEAYGVRGAFLVLCGIFLNNIPMAIIFSNCDIFNKKREVVGKPNEGFDMSLSESTNDENSTSVEHGAQNSSPHNRNNFDTAYVDGTEYDLHNSEIRKVTTTLEERHFSSIKDEHVNEIIGISVANEALKKGEIESNSTRASFKNVCFSKLGCLYAIYVLAGATNMSMIIGFLSVYQDINVYNGMTISQSGFTFMSYSLMNILSRFLPLIPAKFPGINSFMVPFISSLCGGIGQLILLINTSFTSSLIAMAFTAVSDGGWAASMQAISFEILPQEFQATGFGFMLTIMGVAAAATGPLFGSIRDSTSSYQGVLITTTTMLFTSAVISLVCLFISQKV